MDPRVLQVRALPDDSNKSGMLDLCRHRFIGVVGRVEHVSLDLGSEPLRLDVIQGTILKGPAAIEVAIALGAQHEVFLQLLTLQRLHGFLHGRVTRSPQDRRLPRWILALRVLDAKAEGASLRDIARGILVTNDWPGAGEWVKSSARRLVGLAEALFHAGPAGVLAGNI